MVPIANAITVKIVDDSLHLFPFLGKVSLILSNIFIASRSIYHDTNASLI